MKISHRLTSLAALVLAVSLPTSAALAQSKIVFVTSDTTAGTISGRSAAAQGIPSADAMCQRLAAAALPRLPAAAVADGFKAWLSDSSTSPSTTFTQATIPYVLVNSTQVAPNWGGLTDGSIDSFIDIDENGDPVGIQFVFTGTNTSGGTDAGTASARCEDWTSSSPGGSGISATGGSTGQTNMFWTTATTESCYSSSRLYCFQQGPNPVPVELQSFSID